MGNKATVTSKTPALGVEFYPDQFEDAVTPDVEIGDIDLSAVDFTGASFENVSINGASFTGTITGLPVQQPVALDDVTDVNATSPQDLSILQYQSNIAKWVAVASTDFIDAIIDGGFPATTYVAGFDIDGGVA